MMRSRASQLHEVLGLLSREVTPFVRQKLALMLSMVIASAMLTALGPVALKLLVDGFTGQTERPSISPLLLVLLYAASQWLARGVGEARGMIYRRVERRMFRTLSERMFSHLMHLPLRFHLDRYSGAVSETLTSGLEGFQMITQQLVLTVLPVVTEFATVIVVLARLAPSQFLAIFCCALALYAGTFIHSAPAISKSARTASAARVDAGAAITDGLLNYETVKYFAAESQVQSRVARALARSEREWLVFSWLFTRNGLFAATIFAAFLAATTSYATIEVLHRRMTVGAFVLINTYILQLARPVEMLGNASLAFSQGFGMLAKMLDLFREPSEPRPVVGTAAWPMCETLEFSRVAISYHKECTVLQDVSFRIESKRTLGIVGSSGAGKSTLVRLLMRLLEPDSGEIFLDGVSIADLSLFQLRSAIAVVPQDTLLFNDTLAYNIAFGRPRAALAEIHDAARVAQLHEFIMTLPDGYNTRVGERGLRLSGGERQRVSIARAVLKSPRIYVFDEATSSLDTRTEQTILASLREIAKHSSTLVIAHRLSAVMHADEILVLECGRVVERGTHVGLVHQNGRYAALWHAQQHGAAA